MPGTPRKPSGYQHIDFRIALATDEVAQQTGHEAGAHILEGQRGAVEKFQGIKSVSHGHEGHVEIEGVAHQTVQGVLRHIFAKESVGHVAGNGGKIHQVDMLEELVRQRFDAFRHIKALVGMEGGGGRLVIGTVVVHNLNDNLAGFARNG